MKFLDLFDREDCGDYTIYRLREGEWDELLERFPDGFRRCYIEDFDLQQVADSNSMERCDCLEQFILPDVGHIKSGDFGEIFSYFAVTENLDNKGLATVGPKKWQWKDDRNEACRKCDCVLFHIKISGQPSDDDFVVSVESKMKATASSKHRMQDAIDGANADQLSRLGKTLVWLREKYGRLGDRESKEVVERFGYPAIHGTYKKVYKAIVIFDSDFEDDEAGKAANHREGVSVVAFSIDELKDLYEQTRKSVIESV